jgi:hypothetical protein
VEDRLKKLIILYATHSVANVKEDATLLENTFGKPLEELVTEWGFSQNQEIVENLKSLIESREKQLTAPDKKAQIVECLKILLNLSIYDNSIKSTIELKMDIMRELFFRMIVVPQNWSDGQKKHFDFVFNLLKDWNCYFISYTNDGAKAINKKFDQVINLYVDKSVLDKRDWNRDNLLADAIVNRLKRENLRLSFYDKENIKVGDNLEDKIKPACKKTFAFVQLVQRETFYAIDRTNWCFEEYQIFLQSDKEKLKDNVQYKQIFRKRYNTILTDIDKENLLPADNPYEYESWIQRIFKEEHFLVLPSDADNFDITVHKLACEIVNLKYQFIANVPS